MRLLYSGATRHARRSHAGTALRVIGVDCERATAIGWLLTQIWSSLLLTSEAEVASRSLDQVIMQPAREALLRLTQVSDEQE